MNIRLKQLITIVVLIAFILLAGLLFILSSRYALNDRKVIFVSPGTNLREIVYDLHERGIIHSPQTLIFYLRLLGQSNSIQAGEYQFSGNLSLKKVARILIRGKVKQHAFTLVEGWHLDQLLAALKKTQTIHREESELTKTRLLELFHLDYPSAEGWFLPDTYFYTRANSQLDILTRAHRNMVKALATLWKERPRSLPYQTPYDALIIASMIEKESSLSAERPLIASVIMNRLYKNMPLQIDPTVIYGLGDKRPLTKEALGIDTPYNTYLHRGLPPTPIAMPSLDSLKAAMFPAFTDYYYFVAKGDGSHVFSHSLAEQSKAIKLYLLGKQT